MPAKAIGSGWGRRTLEGLVRKERNLQPPLLSIDPQQLDRFKFRHQAVSLQNTSFNGRKTEGVEPGAARFAVWDSIVVRNCVTKEADEMNNNLG